MARKKATVRPASNAASLLGGVHSVPKIIVDTDCVVCLKKIPAERITALKSLGTPRSQWTHVKCSTTTKIKGIYLGEVGTSKLQLCDKIYNDSVRSVFRRSTSDSDEDEDQDSDSED